MAGEQLIEYYEGLLERLPKAGLAAARSVGVVSRIVSLIELFRATVERAACIAERSAGCRPSGDRACRTGCASIVVSGDSIWKYKSNPFSATIRDGEFRLSVEDVSVAIGRGTAVIMLPAGDGKERFEIDLTNVSGIMKDYYTLMYALKRVESPLRKAAENLARCSREKQLAC